MVAQRPPVLLVIAAQKLRLELRHVHRRRALRLAYLAADAEFHHLIHAPAGQFRQGNAPGDGGAQHVGTPARAVLLIARRHKAGAHRPAAQLAADRRPVAHLDLVGHAALEVQPGPKVDSGVFRPLAQVAVKWRRIDNVAWVEQVVRVKDALDLAEQPIQPWPVKCLVEPAARPPVAVLARQCAAIRAQQTGHKLGDRLHLIDLRAQPRVDQRANMQAAGAGMCVIGHRRAQVAAEGVDLRDVRSQVIGRHSGVFDKRDRLPVAAHAHQQPKPHLAQLPDVGLPRRIEQRRDRPGQDALAPQMGDQAVRPPLQFGLALAAVLDHQKAKGVAVQKRSLEPVVLRFGARHAQAQVVDQLHRRGMRLQDGGRGLQR